MTRLSSLYQPLTIGLAISALAGCAAYKRIDDAQHVAKEAFAQAVDQIDQQRNHGALIKKVDKPWISTKPITKPKLSAQIPPQQDCRLQLVADSPMLLEDFVQIIAADCHLPVRVSQDAWAALAGGTLSGTRHSGSTRGVAAPGQPVVPGIGAPDTMPVQSQGGRSFAYTTGRHDRIQPLRWLNKPLSGLLDVVTSQLGLSWSYRNGTVFIHYVDTRTFRIALSSELDFQSNVSSGASLTNGSSNSGNGGTANGATNESAQKTSVGIKSRFDEDIQNAIEAMLTPGIGQYALSQSIGTITVTDTPEALMRIGSFIQDVNRRMSRKAMLYVTVASVTLTDSDALGINWSLVWNSVSGSFGASLVNGVSPLEGASSAGFGILDTATGNAAQFSGTKAILSALSNQGSVSILRQRGVITEHLQPTPIHLTNEKQYVCGRSQTNTAQVGATESIQMCSVVTGFAMDMLPDIHGNDLTLQFALNMSPPATISQVPGDPEKPVFTASVDRQVFLQRVGMRSGQTLVISDFQEASETAGAQGLGDPSNWMATGNGQRDKTRRVLVIIISPKIMDDSDVQS